MTTPGEQGIQAAMRDARERHEALPLPGKLEAAGQAAQLNDRELIEAIKWMTVRGYGFEVWTDYDADGEITGYGIKR